MGLLTTIGSASARAFGLTKVGAAIKDAFFNLTTLLLHGDGTNGAQNNTFLDSSSNNYTITRSGNTTQGTFSPFSAPENGWSFHPLGGSVLTGTLPAFGNAFTVEMWLFPTTTAGDLFVSASHIVISLQGVNGPGMTFQGSWSGAGYGPQVTLNAWNHLAFVREGTGTNQVKVYTNGVAGTSGTKSGTVTSSAYYIGNNNAGSGAVNGFISNVRISMSTAVYTSNFTPPTAPFTSGLDFLAFQKNRFVETVASYSLTPQGSAAVQSFSPFAPTAPYSASTNGGSGYFDGTGDYLSIADATALQFGSGNFTIQAWIYRSVSGAVHTIASKGASTPTGWVFQVNASNQLVFTDTSTSITTTTTILAGSWTHVAVVRSGTGANQTVLYINAVSSATGTSSTNFNQTSSLNIGADRSNATAFNGYISGLEYVKGTALTITVPTAPPTTSNSPSALLNFTNAGLFDNASKTHVETIGNTQISTSVKKFGSGSLAFDGTGDWLTFSNRPTMLFYLGSFTIEGWLYLNATGVAYGIISKGTATTGWSVNVTSGNKLQFSYTASNLTGATSLAANTWYHFAVVRSGTATGNLKIYLDGVVDATSAGAVTDNFNQTNIGYIGASRTGTTALNGYLDDLRVTLAARTITVPVAPYPDQ